MERDALIGLIDACVTDFDSDGLSDLVPQLAAHLPLLLKSPSEEDFKALVRSARLISFSHSPRPLATCISVLLDIAVAHSPRGLAHQAIPFVERALDLAVDNNLKRETRRACSVYAMLSTEVGIPARAVEYALRAASLAKELEDDVSGAIAFANLTAALYTMGLYRETLSVGLRAIKRFKPMPACGPYVAGIRGNLANAALALQYFSLATDAARGACETMGLPKDASGLLNRVVGEGVWMRGAIGMGDTPTAAERLKIIRNLADAFKSPRLDINRRLAEAAFEIHDGDLTIAVAMLLEILKTSKTMAGVYRDNLVLLVKAYEKAHDHGGALLYLGELVEFLGKSQVSAVRGKLEAIKERVQTPMPGKDDVRTVIMSIQKSPGSHREEIEVPESLYRDALERLAVSAELREDARGRHAYRVGKLSGLLANALGYGRKFCEEIDLAARLHDIGKLGIPDGLLTKPGRLTEAEFTVMQRHTTVGAQILAQCTHPAFRLAETIALHHHEKWDGTGYPKGLKGEDIPEVARIATLADVYDALTHARAYKHAWTHEEAIAEIERTTGTHFEPRISKTFVSLVEHLRRSHGEQFDDFLAEAGKHSSFIQARDQMQQMLNDMEPLAPGELL